MASDRIVDDVRNAGDAGRFSDFDRECACAFPVSGLGHHRANA